MARSLAANPPRRVAPGRTRPRGTRLPRLSVPAPATRALHTLTALIRGRRRLRLALVAVAVSLPLLTAGWLWLRQSPFVAVEHVQISGVHGADAAAVQAALTQAAHGMSTLDASGAALQAAVTHLRVVREVRAIPSFPHTLKIDVREQLPVASVGAAGVRSAVAADGVVLGPALLSSSLPSISDSVVPAAGKHVRGDVLLQELAVLGAAPAALAKHAERVFSGPKGITVAMRNGLLVYFGDAQRPHAKWLSLARVLADSGSAGASYIDVRLPSRPAAGFPAGVTPPDAEAGSSGEHPASDESTIASLAAALPGGSPSTSASTTGEAESTSTASAPGEAPAAATSAPTEAPASTPTGG